MRRAGRIVAECHAALAERIVPGVSTLELDQFAEDFLRAQGATPSFKGYQPRFSETPFPGSICVAIDDVVCHGIPSERRLEEGEIITIDIGARYEGYHGDRAWTYAVGKVSDDARRLMEVCERSLLAGIEQARPGNRLGDIGHAVQRYAEGHGMGVVRELTGHGIGQRLHEEPWAVPHLGPPGVGLRLRAGVTLTIEPMITLGDWATTIDPDGWTVRTQDGSLCAQYEHTIAVTDDGPIILTEL